MRIALIVFLIVLVGIVSLGLGWETGKDYVIDEILKEIRIRRKMQAPQDILTEVVKKLHEIKNKGD